MNYFKRRKLRKQIKHILHDARHARHMREDVVAPNRIQAVREAEGKLKDAWKRRDYAGVEKEAETLIQCTESIYPPRSHPRIREYLEILVVAVTVAMAFRTFFVQPFKIPTGSMEPTLYGIKVEAQIGKALMDYFPLNLVRLAVYGDRYREVHAEHSGVVDRLIRDDPYIYSPNGIIPPFRVGMAQHFQVGDYVTKGQLIASGRVKSGDHIFVNKVRYNFTRPARGDVFVFSTEDLGHPQVQEDTFYIKRLVGLPREAISIDPPYLVANGTRVLEPDVFRRQAHERERGYFGYVFPSRNQRGGPDGMPPPVLTHRNSVLQLDEDEYLPFGDNTMHSLDGRYFGGIREKNIVGPAVAVYWPVSPRWGWIR